MRIGVFPAAEFSRRPRLWQGLKELFSIEFFAASNNADAAIFFCEEALRLAEGRDCIAFLKGGGASPAIPRPEVELTASADLAECLRGRVLPHEAMEDVFPLKATDGDRVLARQDERLFWIRANQDCHSLDLVALEPPSLDSETEFLFQYFESENWLRLLPLLHFCREFSGWEAPAIRACLMIDDPNLRWRSYGYIDYARLATQAREYNYHVSLATVPLDRRPVHRPTAALFRQNSDRLSFCVHGNNHTFFELSRTETGADEIALATQAMKRIAELEVASGLDISRVMTAPHGACAVTMASALLDAGFEAGCISRSSIMIRNPDQEWHASIGLSPAEFLGTGLPVLPRFHMLWDQTYILFSAFLGQPIVPVGHHQDCAGDCDLLRKLAGLINSTGPVEWMDMKAITRSNFLSKRLGTTLRLKMFSRRITLSVPEGIEAIELECPWTRKEGETFSVSAGGATEMSYASDEAIPVRGGGSIEIRALPFLRSNRAPISDPRTPLWAYARRYLCEGRDRLAPYTDRLKSRRNGHK